MHILFFILIVSAFIHFYIQTVVIPRLLMSKKSEIVSFKIRLEELKLRNNISHQQYIITKRIFYNTSLMMVHNDFETMFTPNYHTIEKVPSSHVKLIESIRSNKNNEYQAILKDYVKFMKGLYVTNSFGLFIYFVPFFYLFNLKNTIYKKIKFGNPQFYERVYSYHNPYPYSLA